LCEQRQANAPKQYKCKISHGLKIKKAKNVV
jgi:hypothetical protein